MRRVLLLSTTTGYQTRSFGDAAEQLGVELVFATDRCHLLDDPWGDSAIPVRFFDEDGSVADIVSAARRHPFDGVLAVGDRPTVIAARVAEALGLPGHHPEAAATARDKQRTRECLKTAGQVGPWFHPASIDDDPIALSKAVSYPCVIKPVALSASRGVMRADQPSAFCAAFDRLHALLQTPEIRAERNEAHRRVLIEEFIPGREFALEGLMHEGRLQTLAMFDKPDPLDGPFFEETIYVTPPAISDQTRADVTGAVTLAATAIGLTHGPVHAECRVNALGACVLEVAARPIGGLCARALRFRHPTVARSISLEELLLRHALGEEPDPWRREDCASGVMMIPIPEPGVYRGVSGVDEAIRVPGVEDVVISAKPDQRLVPLPEGASYLGFIFARGAGPADVEGSLRAAHARLRFVVDREVQIVR